MCREDLELDYFSPSNIRKNRIKLVIVNAWGYCLAVPIIVLFLFFVSEIYTKLLRNNAVQAKPAIMHYGGFEVEKHHQQVLVSNKRVES